MTRQKVLLLGSGQLGKTVAIALQRLAQYVIAVDSFKDAPAMQLASEYEVINMLGGKALDAIVAKHKPHLIVTKIKAIKTERFYDYEKQGITVVPNAKVPNFTMKRKAIRDLAAKDLGLRTAKYLYLSPRPHHTGLVTLTNTQNLSEFELHALAILGFPIPEIQLKQHGALPVLLANAHKTTYTFDGVTNMLQHNNKDIRLFTKPTKQPYQRMGAVLTYNNLQSDINAGKQKAIDSSKQITITID